MLTTTVKIFAGNTLVLEPTYNRALTVPEAAQLVVDTYVMFKKVPHIGVTND